MVMATPHCSLSSAIASRWVMRKRTCGSAHVERVVESNDTHTNLLGKVVDFKLLLTIDLRCSLGLGLAYTA